MKTCPNCHQKNSNNSDYCEKCGQGLWNVPIINDSHHPESEYTEKDSVFGKIGNLLGNPIKKAQDRMYDRQVAAHWRGAAQGAAYPKTTAQGAKTSRFSGQFVDKGETEQATIGAGYLANILGGGSLERGAAILTEKRIYYYGKRFSNIGSNTTATTEESIISVGEVTATGFVHKNPMGQLVAAILCLALAIFTFFGNIGSTSSSVPIIGMLSLALFFAGVVFFVLYFLNRSTVLEIAFPGGRFCFDTKWHGMSEANNFQRQVHLMKDRLANSEHTDAGEKATAAQ